MKKVSVSLTGPQMLEDPIYNKGTAFTDEERHELGLHGLLPFHVSTIEEQVQRRYANFLQQSDSTAKFTFLSALQNRNEVLFYRLVLEHVEEMVPLIYTPTVGDISINYSHLYSEQRGLYISYPQRQMIDELIQNVPRSEIDVIVITDGERILGLGDLGVGGMAIPVGKLALYTLFGGIDPSRTLPILLDVGTNNEKMLKDPLYLGWKNKRITGKEYDDFIETSIQAIKKRWPNVLLQWEDFSKGHAQSLLDQHRNALCSFNDDIQGTAAVALAAVYSAMQVFGTKLKDQRFVLLGAGSAGMGICNQLVRAIIDEGYLSEAEARRLFYIVDRDGLIQDVNHTYGQAASKWVIDDPKHISLLEVVRNAKPTVLIGVSTAAGAFTEEIVKEMQKHVERPIIFPLSNPTSRSEAHPADLIKWTKGKAIIATGSPFDPVAFDDKIYQIAQCNNVYIFPGVGLGLIAAKATYVSDAVFIKAAKILASHSPMKKDPNAPLFPTLDRLREVSKEIGVAVAKLAIEEGNSKLKDTDLIEDHIEKAIWYPEYPIFSRK